MIKPVRLAAVMLTALVAAAFCAGTASAATLHSTQGTVVRPVNLHGHAVKGYTVSKESDAGVTCGDPSLASVDNDIYYCSPDALYGMACWKSATKHHVLCLRDARTKRLVSVPVSGHLGFVHAVRRPAPLNLRLANGTYCALRDGGAASTLEQHPTWAAYYYCTHGLAVWAPMNAANSGVSRAHRVWTVAVGKADGTGRLTTRKVAHAWYVGTKG